MKRPDLRHLWPHRYWLGLLAFAFVLTVASPPFLRMLTDEAIQNLSQVKAERMQAQQALHQMEGDFATVQGPESNMSAVEAEQFLAPVDRLRVATILEHAADEALVGHFTYTLSPEQKTTISGPEGTPQELAVSTITVGGDVPSDIYMYNFVEGMRRLLPGRLRVQQVSLERSGKEDAPLDAYNLRFTATLEWLSNGTTKDMAGVP